MSKILFMFAHMDDESFGPAGTIAKLSQTGNDVIIVSATIGRFAQSIADMRNNDKRRAAFDTACTLLNGSDKHISYDNFDLSLSLRGATDLVEKVIKNVKPEIVYTHNISDLHSEHRMISEACLVACRPTIESSVIELNMCEVPPSTNWAHGQLGPPFQPNYYVDIYDQMDVKMKALETYRTSEVYGYPDSRSMETVESLAKYRGREMGLHRAEAFKQVFRLG